VKEGGRNETTATEARRFADPGERTQGIAFAGGAEAQTAGRCTREGSDEGHHHVRDDIRADLVGQEEAAVVRKQGPAIDRVIDTIAGLPELHGVLGGIEALMHRLKSGLSGGRRVVGDGAEVLYQSRLSCRCCATERRER
jgi:hypothetical protein